MSRLTVASACAVLFVGLFAVGGSAAAAEPAAAPSTPSVAQAAAAPAATPVPLAFLAASPLARAKCGTPLPPLLTATFLADISRDPDDGTTIIVVPPIDPLTGCGNCPGVCNSSPACIGKKISQSCGPNGETCIANGAGCTGAHCCECV